MAKKLLLEKAHVEGIRNFDVYKREGGYAAVEKALKAGTRDVDALEKDVRKAAGKFVSERTKRRPMIVPIVMET